MSKQKGFTIIEVMIALGLLSIGLLAIGGAEVNLLTQSKRSSDTMKASAAAENIIGLMRRNSDRVGEYAAMDTKAASSTAVTQKEFDFNDWKIQVEKVAGATGTVQLNPPGTIRMRGSKPVLVTITWPARTFVLAATIVCNETVCP